MILTLLNPETADLEKSYLSNSYAVGTASIAVKNADRFALNDRVMLGEMGEEKTEVVTVTAAATDGMTLTIGGTVFSHEADTPIYKLRFDQVKFYRSTTTSTGSYSVLSTQNLDVDNANLTTIYDDTTGLSSCFYKMTLYHSISTLESAYTDVISGGGYRRNQVGYLIDQVLQEVGDQTEQHVTRNEILGYFNEVNDDLTIGVAKPYEFLKTRTTLAQTVGQNYINFPTDSNGNLTMWKFDRMDYNYVDSSTSPTTNLTYTLEVIDPAYFRNRFQDNTANSTTESDTIHTMTLDTSVNRFRFDHPFLTTNSTLYLHYYQYFPTLDSEGDEFLTPTPKIYKLYFKMRYYTKRQVIEPSFAALTQQFTQEYGIEKARYSQHNRKDVGTPRSFRIPTSVDKGFRVR
jgi:hypothetical protein